MPSVDKKLLRLEISKALEKFEGAKGYKYKLEKEIELEVRKVLTKFGAKKDTPVVIDIGDDGMIDIFVGKASKETAN